MKTICRRLAALLLLFLLMILRSSPAFGQDEDEEDSISTVVADTMGYHESESHYDDEKTAAHFDTLRSVAPVKARVISDTTITKLKQDDDYWYADMSPAKEKKQTRNAGDSLLNKQWFRNLLWILISLVFLAAVIWFLAGSNISLFRKRREGKAAAGEEETEEDIFALAYEKEIAAAIASGQYRVAVRLLFLQTLKEMAERGIIQYRQDKTNSDYLMQLYNTGYYKDFFTLTRTFEYTWYGQQEPGTDGFAVIRNNFDSFKSHLRS